MGWGRTLLLGDIGNRLDIADTERDISQLRHRLRTQTHVDDAQDDRLDRLEAENTQLKLYLSALLRLLVAKGTLTEAELTTFVDVIDAGESERPDEVGGSVLD